MHPVWPASDASPLSVCMGPSEVRAPVLCAVRHWWQVPQQEGETPACIALSMQCIVAAFKTQDTAEDMPLHRLPFMPGCEC